MFYTIKEGSKYFILGKMSSGRQKNIQYKKEGGVHKKEGRIQASRTSDRTSEAVQASRLFVQGFF